MNKQCVIYTRFSPRPDAAECDSCDKQQERCMVYADNKHYNIEGMYRDENVSGGKLFRPGLQRAIEALKPDWILIVDRSDRLARDIAVGLAIRTQIRDLSCTIEYVDGTPSGDNPEDTLFQNIMSSFATYERDRTRFATKRAMGKKRKACERVGQLPVGWMLDPYDLAQKRLIKYPEEWECIRIICSLYNTLTISQTTDHMNRYHDHVRKWKPKTVRRLLKKHRYWACPKTGDPELEPAYPI